MYAFDFDRSFVLNRLRVNGDTVRVETAFHGSVSVPKSGVHFIETPRLEDSSVMVVDLGPPSEFPPTSAIVAVDDLAYRLGL